LLVKKRHPLSSKDLKSILERAKEVCSPLAENIDRKKEIELVELATGEKLYLQDGKPIFIEEGDKLIPSLAMPQALLNSMPEVVVDMGAVSFVVKGADVMAPGIRAVTPGAKPGDVVLVKDEKYSKGLAVGILLMERDEILTKRKGKAVKNVHYVGDKIWNLTKAV
jgi:PUA domain protein